MTGMEIARELVRILSLEYSISVVRLLACMRDIASSNNVAMGTIKVCIQMCCALAVTPTQSTM